jgi:DNA-binding Lrp family transcriptional regulator
MLDAPMDSLDHTLLGLLRSDARMSVADLAKKLTVSRATVGNRIKRLEQSGIIVGYTVRLRPDATEHPDATRSYRGNHHPRRSNASPGGSSVGSG